MPRKTKMNRLTSPEKTARINKSNLALRDEFLASLRSQQHSEGTIKGYSNDLLILFTFILEKLENKDFKDLTRRDVIMFQNWLVGNGNSSSRIRRIKSTMSSPSNYCEDILAFEDPEYKDYRAIVRKVKDPALQATMPKVVWEPEEFEVVLQELVKKKKYEIACYMALGAYSGRRKSELTRFKISDFYNDKLVCDGAFYKSDPIKTKGHSGGTYMRCYVLRKPFLPYLTLWLEERSNRGGDSEWLFPNPNTDTGHIEVSTVNSWVATVDSITTKIFNKNFHAHTLRHMYTTALYKAGLPESLIQDIIQWKSADMVKLYLDVTPEDQMSKYFKDGEIVAHNKKSLEDM